MRFLILIPLLALSACLDSPLLHHADASAGRENLQESPTPACAFSFEKYDLCAGIYWTKRPTTTKPGEFLFRFWDAKHGSERGPYVDPGETVFVKLWMPAMGHGSSPVTVQASKDGHGKVVPGVFYASDAYFIMSGTWEIWIQLRRDTDVRDQAKIEITIP